MAALKCKAPARQAKKNLSVALPPTAQPGHALWLALCDLGDPGWGDSWFPHSAVLLHSLDIWQCDVCVCVSSFVLFPAIPLPELIQYYQPHLLHGSGLDRQSLSKLLVCLVWVVVWLVCVLFLFFVDFCVFVFFVLFFSMDCDGCWTMYRSLTSPLLWLLATPCMH